MITITTTKTILDPSTAIAPIIDGLDTQLGVLLTSGFDFPGRYSRWDIGFINPPLQIITRDRQFTLKALNERGQLLLKMIAPTLSHLPLVLTIQNNTLIQGQITPPDTLITEENRSKQNSIFTLLRHLIQLFKTDDPDLGLYGAFGYDVAFQFDPIPFKIERKPDQRDIVLYLPDELIVVDHNANQAYHKAYTFSSELGSTATLTNGGTSHPFQPNPTFAPMRTIEPGHYAKLVDEAKAYFKRGDLFEVVPGHSFFEPCQANPSQLFRALTKANPAPYSSFMNLGESEYLVGVSPEMFVRSQGSRIETCPISGTIARGKDPIEDAQQILTLLSSEKEKSELTMCTDVDRNDKSRICKPGSVRVIGRRQIELYSKVIHTVDHVEGILEDGYDALDAFLSHTWAVTVTGAPKLWAMKFIEDHETSPRHWYGGAIGMLGFNGDINTGITLRTMRIKNGVAEVRVGATLLFDADPIAEEKETEIKASALLQVIRNTHTIPRALPTVPSKPTPGQNKTILLLDYEDSFVHTLANYFRQTGATVTTIRATLSPQALNLVLTNISPDLVVLSPGPGTPKHFEIPEHIKIIRKHNLPIFGICLGLQSLIVEAGGTLSTFDHPVHGRDSQITLTPHPLFKNLPSTITIGRYHSLYANLPTFPHDSYDIIATTPDNIVMAIAHKTLPITAVQFHPESIMSAQNEVGYQIIENVVTSLANTK